MESYAQKAAEFFVGIVLPKPPPLTRKSSNSCKPPPYKAIYIYIYIAMNEYLRVSQVGGKVKWGAVHGQQGYGIM